MGAETFFQTGRGKTPKEAFAGARAQAAYEHGHGGYSGTLAEKTDFVLIDVPQGVDPKRYANQLIEDADERVDDKWGPAGCVFLREENGENVYLFFGWASS